MCQSKSAGGKRCAAHTRPGYLSVMGPAPGAEPPRALQQRLRDHGSKVVAYATTPSGSNHAHQDLANLEAVYAQRVSSADEATAQAETVAELRALLHAADRVKTVKAGMQGPSPAPALLTAAPTAAQVEAVHAYTGRGEISFWDLNNKLRRQLPLSSEESEVVAQINDLAAATPAARDYVVVRGGARFDRLFGDYGMTNDLTGKNFTDRSFASTTTDTAIMRSFARGTHKWEMEIQVPAGTPIVRVPSVLGEDHEMAFQQEHLLPPGTRYRITGDSGPGTVPRRLTLVVRPPQAPA